MTFSDRIYFDFAATTPLDPRALEAMLPYYAENFGNPSSVHRYGQRAESAVESAREKIALIFSCSPDEILFTSGGSESDNLALRGAAFQERETRGANKILISPIEHPAVKKTAEQLRDHFGFLLEYFPIDHEGVLRLDEVDLLLDSNVAVVSVIHASNEVGSIQPIATIGDTCRRKGIPFHTDSVQAAAHHFIRLSELPIDLLSVSAHKFYGPKGIGILFRRKGVNILPMQTGGSQEFGFRAGTHNVPSIVGMARALELTRKEMESRSQRLTALRDRLLTALPDRVPECVVTGSISQRLPNHASFAIRGIKGNHLLAHMDLAGYAVSSGSACKTGLPEPSDVLTAMGFSEEWSSGSLRITLGPSTTDGEVERFLEEAPQIIQKARDAEGAK